MPCRVGGVRGHVPSMPSPPCVLARYVRHPEGFRKHVPEEVGPIGTRMLYVNDQNTNC